MSALIVRTGQGELLANLVHQDGGVQITCIKQALTRPVNQWLAHGLDEWIGEGDAAQPRHTSPTAPEFLPRLGAYLTRQFPALDIQLKD